MAPSQTGLFFDDLRSRSNAFRNGTVDESAPKTTESGVYDYSRGEYTGESYGQQPSGGPAPIGDDLTRAMGSQNYRAGYLGSSKRSVGDYTGASSSPYPNTSSYFAPTYSTDPFLAGKRNIKLGPVNIGLGFNMNVDYNDNITQAHTDPLDDIIAALYLNVNTSYRFTRNNGLTLSGSFGIDHYFNHPEKSPRGKDFNLNVFPGTTLAFDIGVGDIHFVLYDRVSVRPASQSEFTLDDKNVFGVFENDIGLAMNWAINSKLSLSLNYNRSDSTALKKTDSSTDRTIDSFFGSLAWTPTGTYTIGLEGSCSWIDYAEIFNNDGTTSSIGGFIALPITHNTMLKASAGWQEFKFDQPPLFTRTVSDADLASTQAQIDALNAQAASMSATASDPVAQQQQLAAIAAQQAALQQQLATQTVQKQADDATEASRSFDNSTELADYYYNVTLFNQLNARISHQLSLGHESSLNTSSNFTTADYASYGVGLIAWRGARFSFSTYYEDATESGGRLADVVKQWGLDALLTHRLTDRLTAGLGYHHGNTDSAAVGRDYQQQSYNLDLSYSLNQKTSLGLGYHFLSTQAEAEQQSYEQHRFTFSMNYNF